MSIDHGLHTAELNDEMTRRALQLVLDKATDMAATTLKVPLHYYRDPKLTEIEESQILRRTRWRSSPAPRFPTPMITWCAQCWATRCWSPATRMV